MFPPSKFGSFKLRFLILTHSSRAPLRVALSVALQITAKEIHVVQDSLGYICTSQVGLY